MSYGFVEVATMCIDWSFRGRALTRVMTWTQPWIAMELAWLAPGSQGRVNGDKNASTVNESESGVYFVAELTRMFSLPMA